MRKILIALLTILLISLIGGQVLGAGTTFNAVVTNDSMKAGSIFFTINLYCNNDDTVSPPPPPSLANRVTWTSPFAFNGDISIDWIDAKLLSDSAYFDSTTASKFVTPQFYSFFDILKVIIFAESWGDGLPDRFSFVGIANTNGYPPGLGKIKIASWHAKTASKTGRFCMEKGDMKNNSYDWVFDDPMPNFIKQCWSIEADTLKAVH